MRHLRIFALLPILVITGCPAPYVEAPVSNRTPQTMRLLEEAHGLRGAVAYGRFHVRGGATRDDKNREKSKNAEMTHGLRVSGWNHFGFTQDQSDDHSNAMQKRRESGRGYGR